MEGRGVISFLIGVFILALLSFYWFAPYNSEIFESRKTDSNFSIAGASVEEMQFYQNMRFPSNKISYLIDNCPLGKKNEMEYAFEILENKTTLEFYPVTSGEEISITCESKNKIEDGMFIAGEGGPTNITRIGEFSLISHGTILLIKESDCKNPNIAIHELLHALGFDHSANPKNVMYNITSCDQKIGQDTLDLIDYLYSFPSSSDLLFEDVCAEMRGRYLSVNFTIRNNGLKNAANSTVEIYSNKELLKEIEIDKIDVGYGRIVALRNLLITSFSLDGIDLYVNYSAPELNKKNNWISLKSKK
jgi:hypothetical protein